MDPHYIAAIRCLQSTGLSKALGNVRNGAVRSAFALARGPTGARPTQEPRVDKPEKGQIGRAGNAVSPDRSFIHTIFDCRWYDSPGGRTNSGQSPRRPIIRNGLCTTGCFGQRRRSGSRSFSIGALWHPPPPSHQRLRRAAGRGSACDSRSSGSPRRLGMAQHAMESAQDASRPGRGRYISSCCGQRCLSRCFLVLRRWTVDGCLMWQGLMWPGWPFNSRLRFFTSGRGGTWGGTGAGRSGRRRITS